MTKHFFSSPPPLPCSLHEAVWRFSIQLLEPLLFSCAFFFCAFLSLSFSFPQPAYNVWLSRVRHGYIICWLILYSTHKLHMYSAECGTCWWVSYLELAKERSPFCLSSNELWIRWTERVKQTDEYTLWIYGTSFQGDYNNQYFWLIYF